MAILSPTGDVLSVSAPAAEGRPPAYVFVYPNLMINRYGPWMDTNVVRPTGPSSCTVRFDWWVEPERSTDSKLLREVGSQSRPNATNSW